MSAWRRYAKAGRWDLIDWSHASSVPKGDWPKLLRILQGVVPKVVRRAGIEYREVYAGWDDPQAIRDWVDSGRYANALADIGRMLPRVRAAEPSPADEQRQSQETPQQRTERTARLVRHAAVLLDELTAFLVEETPWYAVAEEAAIVALRAAGIEYCGLQETHVVEEPPGSKVLIEAAGGNGMSLETLASIDQYAYLGPWHAARVLVFCQQFQNAVSLVTGPRWYQPSKQTVVEHMNEAASLAYYAGRHVQAIWGKNFEVHTLKGMAIPEHASKGGKTTAAANKDTTEAVLTAMEQLFASGQTLSGAARIAAKRMGKSENACRALWYRYRGPKEKL